MNITFSARHIMRLAIFIFFVFEGSLLVGQDRHVMLPDFFVAQIGGSIGFHTVGFGYYAFQEKTLISAHIGIEQITRTSIAPVAGFKFLYSPLKQTVWNRVTLHPLDFGATTNLSLWTSANEKRERSVATTNERAKPFSDMSLHLTLQSALTYEFKERDHFTAITGYIEISTRDLDMIRHSHLIGTLRLQDLITIGTGLRIRW